MSKKANSEKDSSAAINSSAYWRLKKVKALPNYCLEVEFNDGLQGTVEMKSFIMQPNAGVFEKLRDEKIFNQVHLEHGAVTWPGELDLAPDAMHDEIQKNGKWIL